MTEAVVLQRVSVSSTGFSNPLNLPANAEEATHVKVYGDDVLLVEGVDYTLDGVGDTGDLDAIDGVDVIFENDFLVADAYETFTVEHDPPEDQDYDLSTGGTLGRLFMGAVDALARRMQSMRQVFMERALRLPVDVVDVDVVLPFPDPGKALKWNDAGTALINTVTDAEGDEVAAASGFADAAEASATAAAASAATALAQANSAAVSAALAIAAAAAAGDLSSILPFLVPVGTKLETFDDVAPTYYLACDGSAVSRTTYAALFAKIGTTYGIGDGSTTFNLPLANDGRFFRATGGTAAAQGVLQTEMIGPHDHEATISNGGSHSHDVTSDGAANGSNSSNPLPNFYTSKGDQVNTSLKATQATSTEGLHSHTATVASNDGTENRPRNMSVLVCIKY